MQEYFEDTEYWNEHYQPLVMKVGAACINKPNPVRIKALVTTLKRILNEYTDDQKILWIERIVKDMCAK